MFSLQDSDMDPIERTLTALITGQKHGQEGISLKRSSGEFEKVRLQLLIH